MSSNTAKIGSRSNYRSRFNAAFSGQPVNHIPLIDLGYWPETIDAWRDQGLPSNVNASNSDEYFGLDGLMRYYVCPDKTDGTGPIDRGMITPGGWRIGLWPFFDEAVLEQEDDTELVQVPDGTVVRRHRSQTALPATESYTLVDRKSWEKHYVWRLNPDHPERAPKQQQAVEAIASDSDRDFPLILPGGSLYGWLRNWLGFEQISMLIYDDPDWLNEMLDRVCDCIVGVLQRALSNGGKYDACLIWEDMAYNAGPMVSPKTFKELLSPRYRRITETLHAGGVETIIVDSDGKIDDLIPLWLDAGVNTLMPIEIGTTGMDPVTLRQQFGAGLKMIGGFDKRILWKSRDAIAAEVERLTPVVHQGGFIPCCDHKVPPEVRLDDYMYFIKIARQRWCSDT